MSGYRVDLFDPWTVSVRGTVEDRALRDGADASDVYLGRRTVRTIVSVFGSTIGDFWDKADDLLAAFNPRLAYNADTAAHGFLPFDFYQPTADIATWPTSAYPNGIPMRFYLRPFSIEGTPIDRATDGGVAAKGMAKKFSIGLIARKPQKYSAEIQVIGASQIVNKGNYPALPSISVSSVTTTATIAATINGSSFTILYDPALGVHNLNSEDGVLYVGGVVNYSKLVEGSQFPDLAPGVNIKTVTGMPSGGTLLVTYRHTWA